MLEEFLVLISRSSLSLSLDYRYCYYYYYHHCFSYHHCYFAGNIPRNGRAKGSNRERKSPPRVQTGIYGAQHAFAYNDDEGGERGGRGGGTGPHLTRCVRTATGHRASRHYRTLIARSRPFALRNLAPRRMQPIRRVHLRARLHT